LQWNFFLLRFYHSNYSNSRKRVDQQIERKYQNGEIDKVNQTTFYYGSESGELLTISVDWTLGICENSTSIGYVPEEGIPEGYLSKNSSGDGTDYWWFEFQGNPGIGSNYSIIKTMDTKTAGVVLPVYSFIESNSGEQGLLAYTESTTWTGFEQKTPAYYYFDFPSICLPVGSDWKKMFRF